jgi:dTDP-4-amino-4,6-dideoxygalactose transaminase
MEIWQQYHRSFETLERTGAVRRPIVPPECTHNAHMYYLLLPSLEKRTQFISALREKDIHPVFHYVPLHSSPMGRQCGRTAGPMCHTDGLSDRLVRLPLWLGLEDHLAFVISEIIDAAA